VDFIDSGLLMNLSLALTIGICGIITGLVIRFHIRFKDEDVAHGPSLVTMLGIGGTFLGIALGLWTFQPNDIQASIPTLIDGIRLSVWASFVGVLAAISLKIRGAFQRHAAATGGGEADTGSDVGTQLDALLQAIGGSGESTVVSQMKLARSDMNDRLAQINKSQEAFMERLAEMSSKTLVEALRGVIADFNAKITEQFGDNFKQLNDAVGKLLEWQRQYRDQMDILIATETESAGQLREAVEQHKAALGAVRGLFEVAQMFVPILEAAGAYKAELRANTERMSALVEMLVENVPLVTDQVNALVTALRASVLESQLHVDRLGKEISEGFRAATHAVQVGLTESLATANREITASIVEGNRLVVSSVADGAKEATARVVESNTAMAQSLTEANRVVSQSLTNISGTIKEQTEALQAGIEDSLTESLNTMAAQLASLSQRFADDYGPLTDKLRQVVALASSTS
jgi:uncharacterized protein YdbL (DUF1318 family)